MGILGLTCFWLIAAIPAVICGHVAYSRIRRSAGALTGEGLALGGMITGYIGIAVSIFLIPLMAAIAIPNFVKARTTAQMNACINNLRQIDGAKLQWALADKKQETDTPRAQDLAHTRGATKVSRRRDLYAPYRWRKTDLLNSDPPIIPQMTVAAAAAE